MKSVKCLFVLAALVLSAGMAGADPTDIIWRSPQERMNILSDSQPWGSDFQLELGSFKAGFTPAATNTAQWATNWVAASRTNYNQSLTNSPRGGFAGSYTFTSNNGPITNGGNAYIWGFGGSELAGQWILLQKTNGSAWRWPNPAALFPPPLLWSTGSAETLLGTINTNTNAPFHLQTVTVANSALPPTTWAQWAESQLGQTNHGNSDYNSNGITDIWEYALHADGSGRDPDPASWLQQAEVGGERYLEIHIPRRRDHPANYTVEVSNDLQNWASGPSYTEVVGDTMEALVVRDKLPIGEGGDRRFMRVRVSVP